MNNCPNCGKRLTRFNRDTLLCRQCAKEFAIEQRTAAKESSSKGVRPPNIFISYRPSDSPETTRRIYDRLVDRFGRKAIFRDLEGMALGVPFRQLLNETLTRTGAVLVIIGPTWLSVKDRDGRKRLEDAHDVVRMEVETALRHGVPVIPIATPNASLPTCSELPAAIVGLAERNGLSVRPEPDFQQDLDHLVANLEAMLGQRPTTFFNASPEVKLETELLRIDHDWQVEQARHNSSTEPNAVLRTRMVTVLSYLTGLVLAYLGIQCLISALLPDVVCLFFVLMGIVVPTYTSYKRFVFAKARRRYEHRRAEIQARLQHLQSPEIVNDIVHGNGGSSAG